MTCRTGIVCYVTLSRCLHTRAELFPIRVGCFNESNLFGTPVFLDRFFPGDSLLWIMERLTIYQFCAAISMRKRLLVHSIAVFPDASFQIVRHPGVKHATRTGEDVDEIHVFCLPGWLILRAFSGHSLWDKKADSSLRSLPKGTLASFGMTYFIIDRKRK